MGGDTLVPATESDSPIATGRTDAPAAIGAGAEPVAGTAVGVAVAVSAVAVAVVAGTGAAPPTPKPDSRFAAGVPGSVAPAGGVRFGAEFAAGVPMVEVAVEIALLGAVVVGAEMLPPVSWPGPAPEGNELGGAIAAVVEDPACVGLVCATAAGVPNSTANSNVATAMAFAPLIPLNLMRPSDTNSSPAFPRAQSKAGQHFLRGGKGADIPDLVTSEGPSVSDPEQRRHQNRDFARTAELERILMRRPRRQSRKPCRPSPMGCASRRLPWNF